MDVEVKTEPTSSIGTDGYELVGNMGPQQASGSGNYIHSSGLNEAYSFEELAVLLKEWDVYPLYERCVQNLIDVSVLEYMIDLDIVDLCKNLPMRYRIILRHKLKQKNYQSNQANDVELVNPASLKKRQTTSSRTDLVPAKQSKPNPETSETSHASNNPTIIFQVEPLPSNLNNSNQTNDYSQYLKREQSLVHILEQSDQGRKFLDQYKVENGKRIYSAESRDYLKKALVDHYFRIGQGHISAQDFNEMVALIMNELPDEDPTIWFAQPKIEGTSSTGYLYGRYRYLCQINRKPKKESKKQMLHHSALLTQQAKESWEMLSSTEQNDCRGAKSKLLNVDNNVCEEIIEAWKTSYPLRRYETVTGVLKLDELQPLTHFEKTHDLLTYDFCRILSIENDIFYNRVPHFVSRFKTVYDGYKSRIEERALSAAIQSTFNDPENETSERARFLAFYSLPFLCRQSFVTGKGKGRKKRKIGYTEVRDSFITLLSAKYMIELCIKSRQLHAATYSEPSTPFIVGIGDVANGVHEYYVVLENLIFPCATVVQAVDFLMKLYTVLHIEYAGACESVMRFIQAYLYELKFQGERSNTFSAALITDFNRL